MKESPLKLQDKSVLIFGDFNGLSQALIRDFTENGADVGFINHEKTPLHRFLEAINDTREVHSTHGRVAHFDVDIMDSKSAFDAVSGMAEVFGRIDVVVDLKMASLDRSSEGGALNDQIAPSRFLLEQVSPYFISKKRGRIVFVREDESAGPLLPDNLTNQLGEEFFPWTKTLAKSWPTPAYGVNAVTVGLTEDLLLRRYPESRSIRATMEMLKEQHPDLRLVDSNEITAVVLFLSSQASSGLSGQTLRVARSA